MVVHLCKVSQTLRETFPVPFTEVCNNTLCRTVSILLLVGPQFERIDQVFTQTLWYRVHSEDLSLVDTFACLHHQQPVWRPSIIFFHGSHTTNWCAFSPLRPAKRSLPQDTCLQCGHKYDIVTPPGPPVGGMMRRKQFVLLNIPSCTVLSFLASSFATFSKASCSLPKAHSGAFAWTLKIPLYSSQSPPFNARKARFIILRVQSVSLQHFTCSKYSLAGDSRCHRPCIPSCFSFSASSRNFFTFDLSQVLPTFLVCTGLSPCILHNLPRCALFSTTAFHCHFVNGVSPIATRILLSHYWHTLVMYDSSPSSLTTDANCQTLRFFSLNRLSHRNMGFGGTLIALGTKLISSAPPAAQVQ